MVIATVTPEYVSVYYLPLLCKYDGDTIKGVLVNRLCII